MNLHGVDSPTRPASERRATGTSLAVIVFVVVCFAAVMTLHVVRLDIDPVRQVMSEYANGSHGVIMTVAFYAYGLAVLALAFRLRGAIDLLGATRVLPVLLGGAGLGLLLSGAFEVGAPGVPDTLEETLHSVASIGAFVLLIASMLLLCAACGHDRRWATFALPSWLLAGTAAVAAMASPIADRTPWSGLLQRVLGGAILLWVLMTAVRIRSNALRAPDDSPPGRPRPDR